MNNSTVALASINLVLGGLVFLLGLVILRENPHQRLNRVVSLMLFFGGFGAILSAAQLVLPAPAAGRPGVQQAFAYVWEFFFPTLFLFASVFPEERPFTRLRLPGRLWTPPFEVIVFAPHAFHLLLALTLSSYQPDTRMPLVSGGEVLAPLFAIVGVFARIFLNVHQALFSLVDLVFGIAAVMLLVGSWRRAAVARIRQQLGTITLGLTACLALYAFATSIPTLIGRPLVPGLQVALTMFALLLGSGAIAYSVVRWKFLDTKLLARRGILYALASAVLIGVYLLIVQRVNRLVTTAIGLDARVIEPVFLIMALTLFQPVLSRLEDWLDRMFLRDPGDYRNVLRQLGRDLQTTIDLDDLLQRSVRTLTEALLLRSAHVIALTREGPVSRTGAGVALAPDELEGIAALLPRLSRNEPSFRLSDPVDGLRRLDRELLTRKLDVELLVPLRWRGESLGVLLLGQKLTSFEYTSEDVTLLNTLGSQMSVSLQNALLLRDRLQVARFEEELNLARNIQRTFLISDFPALPGFDVHGVNLPSRQVGGDYYDVVPGGDGSYLIAIADVAGKGVPAALLSSMLQAALRTQARAVTSLGGILRNINSLVYRSTAVHQFATFFLARVEPRRGRMTFCNAGHNWPVLVRANGERRFLERGGLLLGILEEVTFEEEEIDLRTGDRIVMYTDGITEATEQGGELYGEDRLVDLLRDMPSDLRAADIAERVLADVSRFLAGVEAQDDRTLVVLRVTATADASAAATDAPELAASR